jgi:hypothetical protein
MRPPVPGVHRSLGCRQDGVADGGSLGSGEAEVVGGADGAAVMTCAPTGLGGPEAGSAAIGSSAGERPPSALPEAVAEAVAGVVAEEDGSLSWDAAEPVGGHAVRSAGSPA